MRFLELCPILHCVQTIASLVDIQHKSIGQMEQNTHCTVPEKLSSLSFCISMNSLCARWGSHLEGQICHELSCTQPLCKGAGEDGQGPPGEQGDNDNNNNILDSKSEMIFFQFCLLVGQNSVPHLLQLWHRVLVLSIYKTKHKNINISYIHKRTINRIN